jgi:phage terminase large subunit-like protein
LESGSIPELFILQPMAMSAKVFWMICWQSAADILNGTIKDLRWLPLIYRIDDEKEALDPQMWHKANPSLKYLTLKLKWSSTFIDEIHPRKEEEFYTKRMNWPKGTRNCR